MDDMTKKTDAGLGHNQPLDPDGQRAREAMRDYDISLAKEQVEREDAIDAAVRYGNALSRWPRCRKSNNELAIGLSRRNSTATPIFEVRQERSAAIADRRNRGACRKGNALTVLLPSTLFVAVRTRARPTS